MKSKSTGNKVASAAAKILKSRTASKAEKAVAASAMAQTKENRLGSPGVHSSAAKILKDPKASLEAKSVGASALTQKDRAPAPPKWFRNGSLIGPSGSSIDLFDGSIWITIAGDARDDNKVEDLANRLLKFLNGMD